MLPGLLLDILLMCLIGAALYLALGKFVRHHSPHWLETIEQHRIRVLFVLGAMILAVKVSIEAISGSSGPIDEAILVMLRDRTPRELDGSFVWITDSGSARVLLPLAALACSVLLLLRRRFEALVVAASMLLGSALIYVVKHAVDRARPALWETDWYWGASFPSGHTLGTAVLATACVLVFSRVWPRARPWLLGVAAGWILLVALSRLVLGVHWPTDVLAAAAIGCALPILLIATLRMVQFRFRPAAQHASPRADDG